METLIQVLIGLLVGVGGVIALFGLVYMKWKVEIIGFVLKFGFLSDPARPDQYYFATEVEENTAKIRLKGGELSEIYFQSQTHKFSGEENPTEKWSKWDIVPRNPGDPPNYYVLTGWHRELFEKTGLWFVGFIFYRLYRYVLGYTKTRMLPNGTTEVYGKENTSEKIICCPQEIVIEGRFEKLETKDQVKVSGPYSIVIMVTNPARWAFVGQPAIQIQNAVQTLGRDYVGNHTYEQMFGSSWESDKAPTFEASLADMDKKKFGDFIRLAFTRKLPGDAELEGARLKLGVKCIRVNVKDLDLDDPDAQAARIAAFNAEKQGQAKVTTLTYEGQAMAARAKGEAKAIQTIAEARADATLKQARADKMAVIDMASDEVIVVRDEKGEVMMDAEGKPMTTTKSRSGLGIDRAFENQQRRMSTEALKQAGAVYTPVGANLIIGGPSTEKKSDDKKSGKNKEE